MNIIILLIIIMCKSPLHAKCIMVRHCQVVLQTAAAANVRAHTIVQACTD